MIDFLRGELIEIQAQALLIDVQGVGYSVLTHLVHKEDQMLLIGFSDAHEKAVYLQLIKVSGVGTRTALGLIETLSAEDIVSAIATGQSNVLKKAPGIGLKTAQRIILELKEKLAHLPAVPLCFDGITISVSDREEIERGLMSLGYAQDEILDGLQKYGSLFAVDDKIEDILRILIEKLSF